MLSLSDVELRMKSRAFKTLPLGREGVVACLEGPCKFSILAGRRRCEDFQAQPTPRTRASLSCRPDRRSGIESILAICIESLLDGSIVREACSRRNAAVRIAACVVLPDLMLNLSALVGYYEHGACCESPRKPTSG